MRKSERFERWFKSSFLLSRQSISPIISSENKAVQERFERICYVTKLLIDNPKMPIEKLRKKVALELFVSMRIALDYINYAKNVLEEYENVKL